MNAIFEFTSCHPLQLSTESCRNRLQNIINILAQYSWIYDVRNIDIFNYDVLEKIPQDWVDELSKLSVKELWNIPFNFIKDEWPTSLKLFIKQCNEVSDIRFSQKFKDTAKGTYSRLLKKTSDKKFFEIEILSNVIQQICQAIKSNIVLDIGSGLGHIEQLLHYEYQICSIGLDSQSKYTLAANERFRDSKSDYCKRAVKYETLEVNFSEEGLLAVEDVLHKKKDLFCSCNSDIYSLADKQSSSVVMIGLHSCGNLTQDMMKLFCTLEEVEAFICVGCCYNKIKLSDFPMSILSKSIIDNVRSTYPTWFPSMLGLRLGSQGTRTQSLSLDSLKLKEKERHTFYRALLEYFIKKENITWRHPKRHARSKEICDFRTYCSKMFEGHLLSGNEETLNKLQILYEEKECLSKRISILLVLQTLLQPLWEVFVIIDRFMYFKEKNIYAEILLLWDDRISSRNLGLFAYKN